MTTSETIRLQPRQRRLIIALAAAIVVPVGGLLGTVLLVENQHEQLNRDLTLYHLPTEALVSEVERHFAELVELSNQPTVGSERRRDDAFYQVRQRLDTILELQESRGTSSFEPVVERVRRRWEVLGSELTQEGMEVDTRDVASLVVGLQQLKRLHRGEANRKIAIHHGDLRSPTLVVGSILALLIAGTLTWRIGRLMTRMAARADTRTFELAESEARFRQLSDNVDAVFWISDVDVRSALFVSSGYAAIWGRSVESLEEDPTSWIESIVPEDRDAVLRNLATVGEGRVSTNEYRVRRPDDSIRWIRDRAFPVRDDDGAVVRVARVAADVTDEKRALDGLVLSESHLRSLMESAESFVVFRVGDIRSGHGAQEVIFVSPSIREVLGVTDPTHYPSWFDVHEDDVPRVAAARHRTSMHGVPFHEEFRILHPTRGEWRWIREICNPVYDSEAGVMYYNGIILDITRVKRNQEELERTIEQNRQLREQVEAENVYLREELLGQMHPNIVGQSEAMNAVMLKAERVATTDATVLVLGDTGTGKELVARAIHRMSDRSRRPLAALNCAAIPAALVESELFGRERGAYTGASTSQEGRFEATDGGTIFLDEVGELPEAVQAKLLRVLEEGKFERLGSTKTIQVDVRVIAATNRDLERMVRDGSFRQDLFYRLNVFPIEIPPLRERSEDIVLLARHFVKEFAEKMGKDVDSISTQSLRLLESYSWPGNVRELRNVIERAMIVARGKTLRVQLPTEDVPEPTGAKALVDVERAHILSTIGSVNWRVRGKGGAAELLGLKPSTLESRMKKLGIVRPNSRRDVTAPPSA